MLNLIDSIFNQILKYSLVIKRLHKIFLTDSCKEMFFTNQILIISKWFFCKRIRISQFKVYYFEVSIVFDMLKCVRLFDGLTKPIPILYMTSKITNSWIKDVVEGVLSQKKVA